MKSQEPHLGGFEPHRTQQATDGLSMSPGQFFADLLDRFAPAQDAAQCSAEVVRIGFRQQRAEAHA